MSPINWAVGIRQIGARQQFGMAALAFAHRPVGVDVEAVRDDLAFSEIGRRFFRSDELRYLDSGPESGGGPGVRNRFFRLWTRKEVVLKALGVGLNGIGELSVLRDLLVADRAQGGAMRIALWYRIGRVILPRMLPAAAILGMRKALEVLCAPKESREVVDRPDLLTGIEGIWSLMGEARIGELEARFRDLNGVDTRPGDAHATSELASPPIDQSGQPQRDLREGED